MRVLLVLAGTLVVTVGAWAQTPAPVTPVAPAPPAPAATALPKYAIGTGVEWNRGAAYPLSNVTSFGYALNSNTYWWNTIDTPIVPRALNAATPSSIRTGAALVPACTGDAAVCLVLLGDLGLTTTPGTTAAGYSAGAGVAIRVGKTHWRLMPLYRMTGTIGGPTVATPEFMGFYTF